MNRTRKTTLICVLILATALVGPRSGFSVESAAASASISTTRPDSSLTRDLSPGRMAFDRNADGANLPSLTIEGEDQVSVHFERPGITLDLQPRTAPGLDWENTWDKVDLFPVVTAFSAFESSAYLGRPWMNSFIADDVVVFRPMVEGVDSWRLSVIDSRGRHAVSFEGKGEPPQAIAWDGRRQDGTPAWPGLIYTHILETRDPAGNLRTYTGEGFELPPYRLMDRDGIQLVLAGEIFPSRGMARRPGAEDPQALIEEAASWLNQIEGIEREIEIRVTARSNRQARRLAEAVARSLEGKVVGDPGRITTSASLVPDAPDHGMIVIATK